MEPNEPYNKNIEILKKLRIQYKECDHKPVLDYNAAEKIREKFRLTGIESKNLFLKTKDGKFVIYITSYNKKADFDRLKTILDSRVSLATSEELKGKTGCVPGCAMPFGNDKEITIIFDNSVLKYEKFIYSPGIPTKSIEIDTRDILKILSSLENKSIRID